MKSDDAMLAPAVRTQLHDAAGQLSLATMQLGLLLESESLDPELRSALAETLEACQGAADALRQIWRIADGG